MERWGRGLTDADIYIDLNKMAIRFDNVQKFKLSQYLRGIIVLSLLTLLLIFLIDFHDHNFDLSYGSYCLSFPTVMVGWIIITSPMVLMLFSSRIRDLYFILRTRKTQREITILNPEGEITFVTRSSNPLIDLEYDDDVRAGMKEVSLTKREKKGKLLKRRINVLRIQFNRKTRGQLIIKEY